MSEIKAGDLDLWTTETEEKVKDHLYEQMGDNVPHPVALCGVIHSVVLGG